MKHYVIRGGAEGRKRLALLGRVFWPTTAPLLDRAGLATGATCLDLGCGGGDVALELAQRVGPTGRVVGLDLDAEKISLARQHAAEKGLDHLRFDAVDVMAWSECEAYDLIYCRFLLTHLPHPRPVLAKIWQALRPGGRAILEDIDFSGHFSHPPNPAFDRYVELYTEVVRRRGGDAHLGQKLFAMTRAAGWATPQLTVHQPTFFAGEGKELGLITLVNIADAVIAEGLATAAELQATVDELATFVEDPTTLVSLPRIFQLWSARV